MSRRWQKRCRPVPAFSPLPQPGAALSAGGNEKRGLPWAFQLETRRLLVQQKLNRGFFMRKQLGHQPARCRHRYYHHHPQRQWLTTIITIIITQTKIPTPNTIHDQRTHLQPASIAFGKHPRHIKNLASEKSKICRDDISCDVICVCVFVCVCVSCSRRPSWTPGVPKPATEARAQAQSPAQSPALTKWKALMDIGKTDAIELDQK